MSSTKQPRQDIASPTTQGSTPGPRLRRVLLAAFGIIGAALVAYHNSLSAPFVFDDETAILANPSILRPSDAWSPPATAGTGGRPLLNVSFAVNYAIGALDVRGYHLTNLAFHIATALVLFGVVRRTLARSRTESRPVADSLPIAVAIAGLWVVHPLTTASVTYVSQRAESLMALFYLLALYGFIRGTEDGQSRTWLTVSWASCLLGAGTKEVIATAPLVILAYDRFFVAGSWREALKQRWAYYTGLAASWIVLTLLMRDVATRMIGFEHGISAWKYALAECGAIVRYLLLSLWPSPLVFDYGPDFNTPVLPTLLALAAIIGLALAIASLWRRGSQSAFLGISFFTILLPTSTVIPIALQPIAENRAYIPLAAVITAAVLGLYRWLGRRAFPILGAVAALLVGLTIARNEDYRSAVTLWMDTAKKVPLNPRAQRNLGFEFAKLDRHEEALAHYKRAVEILDHGTGLSPQSDRRLRAQAENDVATALIELDRGGEAIAHLERSLTDWPGYFRPQLTLTKLLISLNRADEALTKARAFVASEPNSASARFAFGTALLALNRVDEAAAEFDTALRIEPNHTDARMQRAEIEFQRGNPAGAIPHYEAVLQRRPGDPLASQMLGQSLLAAGQTDAAIAFLRTAVERRQDRGAALGDLGIALLELDRTDEALSNLRRALELQPELSIVRFHLGMALGRGDQWESAAREFETILKEMPDNALARLHYAVALANSGRRPQAIRELEAVLAEHPQNDQARELLAQLRGMK